MTSQGQTCVNTPILDTLRLSVTDHARRVAAPAPKVGWVAIELVFETHSTTVDNEQGHATGWLPGQLSERGRAQAQQLGRRRRGDGITAVFSSDLARAAQTASVAFARLRDPGAL